MVTLSWAGPVALNYVHSTLCYIQVDDTKAQKCLHKVSYQTEQISKAWKVNDVKVTFSSFNLVEKTLYYIDWRGRVQNQQDINYSNKTFQ